MHAETDGSSRRREFAVVCRQSKIVVLGFGEQSARQMDRAERTDRGWEWFGRSLEHGMVEPDQIEGFDRLKYLGPVASHINVAKP